MARPARIVPLKSIAIEQRGTRRVVSVTHDLEDVAVECLCCEQCSPVPCAASLDRPRRPCEDRCVCTTLAREEEAA